MKRLIGLATAALVIAVGVRIAVMEDSRSRQRKAEEARARLEAEHAEKPPPAQPAKLALPPVLHPMVSLPADELTIPLEPWPVREVSSNGVRMETFDGKLSAKERTKERVVLVVSEGAFTASDGLTIDRTDEVRVHPEARVYDGSPDVRRLVAVNKGGEWHYGFLFEGSLVDTQMPEAKWVMQDDGRKGTLHRCTTTLRRGQYSESVVVRLNERTVSSGYTWSFQTAATPVDFWINGVMVEVTDGPFPNDKIENLIGTTKLLSVRVFLHRDAEGNQPDRPGETFPVEFRISDKNTSN